MDGGYNQRAKSGIEMAGIKKPVAEIRPAAPVFEVGDAVPDAPEFCADLAAAGVSEEEEDEEVPVVEGLEVAVASIKPSDNIPDKFHIRRKRTYQLQFHYQ